MNLDDLKRRVLDAVHGDGRPTDEIMCTCPDPCCEVDIGIGYVNCGAQHCPVHATAENQGMPSYNTYSGRPELWDRNGRVSPPESFGLPRRPDKVNGVPLREAPGA